MFALCIAVIRQTYARCLDFSGRPTRAEFRLWMAYQLLAQTAQGLFFGTARALEGQGVGAIAILPLWWVCHLLPGLAPMVRRLHDQDRTAGWRAVLVFSPVGVLILLQKAARRGTAGPNRFGPDRHAAFVFEGRTWRPTWRPTWRACHAPVAGLRLKPWNIGRNRGTGA